MKTPYSQVHVLGDYVLAARGGAIHSFNILTGSHLSTWKHPDAEKQATNASGAEAPAVTEEIKDDVDMDAAPPASDEPPAKRQRTDENGDAKAAEEGEGDEAQGQKKPGKKGKKSKNRIVRLPNHGGLQVGDKPLVVLITSTEDGKHVVAVSGHDKSIWVFEHDGEGQLNQVSQRRMPKRPIDILIGPDETIVAADKFGDVYSLPLLYDVASISARPAPALHSMPKVKPSASALTVHSKRNRQALEAQQQWYERQGSKANTNADDSPPFEMDLLLGHVSMLTALKLGESEGRRYLLTADRDEHVRVSRYIPQAHVIENFCLGHKEFIASMVIPAGRDNVLVSGGGDEDLFVWDWKTGARISTTNVLSLAQVVAPETTRVAVSSLVTLLYPTDDGILTYVLAICEGIKAIFSWQLTKDNELNHPGAIQLPGNPLHLTVSPQTNAPTSPPRIVVAIDPSLDAPAAKSLNIFTLTENEGRLSSQEISSVNDEELSAVEAEVTLEQVKALLYTTEQLRKQEIGFRTRDGEEEPALEDDAETPVELEAAAE